MGSERGISMSKQKLALGIGVFVLELTFLGLFVWVSLRFIL